MCFDRVQNSVPRKPGVPEFESMKREGENLLNRRRERLNNDDLQCGITKQKFYLSIYLIRSTSLCTASPSSWHRGVNFKQFFQSNTFLEVFDEFVE